MSCRLCLSETEILIPIYDAEGKDTKGIASTIDFYVNIKLTPNANEMMKICISCWSHLDNFQKFCQLIAEKQRQLKELSNVECMETAKPHEANSVALVEKQGEDEVKSQLKELPNGTMETTKKTTKLHEAKSEALVENQVGEVKKNMSETLIKVENTQIRNVQDKDEQDKDEQAAREKVINKEDNEALSLKAPAALDTKRRKVGRPCKNDINVYQDEDRLIANHMLLICDLCQAEQKTFYDLKRHYKLIHKREGYAVCCNKKLYKKGLLVEHINVHKNPDYFKCEHCDNVFADRVCLRNHTLLKHKEESEQPYACKSCPRKFAKFYFLQRHALRHATGEEKIFQCPECEKCYPSLSRLKGHISNVHGDGGLYVCSDCGASIRGTTAFQKHMRQHEGIVECGVQCEVCGQWLSDKYVLRLHMERHGEQKTYVCDICGKEAPSRIAIKSHYRYHHMNTEPMHKCGACGKAFKTTRSLREHIATHTGEHLYTCSYCPKTFKCSSNLHSHRKWQHPVEWGNEKQIPKKCMDSEGEITDINE